MHHPKESQNVNKCPSL